MGSRNFFNSYIKTGLLCLIIVICLALAVPVWAAGGSQAVSDPEILFKQANNAYQTGDFLKAAELYQQLIDSGYQSGNLYYNLGNAYFKLGAKGRAVLYYEKAERLIPGDADLKANRDYALAGVQEGADDWKYDFMKFLTEMMSVEQLAVFGSVLFFILAFLVMIWIINPTPFQNIVSGKFKKWWTGLVWCISGMFLVFLVLGIITYYDYSQEQAVAIKAGTVRFEPSAKATLYYHLAEGSRVLILEQKESWVKVKRIDGKRGWVDGTCLEKI